MISPDFKRCCQSQLPDQQLARHVSDGRDQPRHILLGPDIPVMRMARNSLRDAVVVHRGVVDFQEVERRRVCRLHGVRDTRTAAADSDLRIRAARAPRSRRSRSRASSAPAISGDNVARSTDAPAKPSASCARALNRLRDDPSRPFSAFIGRSTKRWAPSPPRGTRRSRRAEQPEVRDRWHRPRGTPRRDRCPCRCRGPSRARCAGAWCSAAPPRPRPAAPLQSWTRRPAAAPRGRASGTVLPRIAAGKRARIVAGASDSVRVAPGGSSTWAMTLFG